MALTGGGGAWRCITTFPRPTWLLVTVRAGNSGIRAAYAGGGRGDCALGRPYTLNSRGEGGALGWIATCPKLTPVQFAGRDRNRLSSGQGDSGLARVCGQSEHGRGCIGMSYDVPQAHAAAAWRMRGES
jgi:hypothetical protein